MEKRIWKILLALMVCLAFGGPASAAIVTVEVTGVVDRIEQNGLTKDDSINYGTAMSGFAVYDTETPDLDSSDFQGIYNLISISMSIGSYTLTDYSPPSDSALFDICYDGGPIWRVRSTTAGFDGEIIVNDTPHTCDDFDYLYIQILDAYGEYSSPYSFTDRLPRSSLDLSPFDPLDGRFRMHFEIHDSHDSLWIEGELTSMTLIYEPHEPTTYYVDGIDGNDLNDGLSHDSAFATIQTAVDAAYDGDTVLVADGTYTGDGNRDIEVYGKSITIRGVNGAENCIIDCNGSEDEPHTGFYFHGISSSSNLSGFTVTNGYSSKFEGAGGILCNGANVTFTNCNISDNMAFGGRGGYGGGISVMDGIYLINNCTISNNSTEFPGSGGISCRNSTLTVSNCTINGNSGFDGGGIGCEDSITTISNCIISDNSGHVGGGIYCDDSDSSIISDCVISENSAEYCGGGIFCEDTDLTITNCIISRNTAESDAVTLAVCGGGIFCLDSSPNISNCTIRNNSAMEGGGINCWDSSPTISNCAISENSAGYSGGGIYCSGQTTSIITNCTITNNILRGSGTGRGGGVVCLEGTITNCIIWDNLPEQIYSVESVSYSDIQGGWPGEGNIDTDPCFAFADDYHLMPDSDCIDAGTSAPAGGLPAKDIDGNPRVLDGDGDGNAVVDMGAYEFNSQKPTIAVSSDRFFYRDDWPEIASQTLSIRNCGGGTLNWEIAEDCEWLHVSPISGTSIGNINEVTLTVDASDLETGLYSCTLTVADSNVSNNPVTVQVELDLGAILQVPGQFDTIQAAVDAANDYDIVLVADGIYTGDGNRDIIVDRKGITIRSENGPDKCIIDCDAKWSDYHCGFDLSSNQDTNSVIDGFTITNGYTLDRAGGIYCRNGALTISNCNIIGNKLWGGRGGSGGGISLIDGIYLINNCTISNNSTEEYGGSGGISCLRSALTVNNCNINNNSGSYVGGIDFEDSITKISNSTISGNSAYWHGCGISCYRSCMTINDCNISGNQPEEFSFVKGGGVRCYDSNSTIINCIIRDNSAGEGGGIYCKDSTSTISNCKISGNIICQETTLVGQCGGYGGGIYCDGSSSTIKNSIISGNTCGDEGGGICFKNSSSIISNCTFAGNSSYNGNSLACISPWWQAQYPSSVEVSNCILWNGGDEIFNNDGSTITVSYSDIQGGWPGEGNMDDDPCFADPGFWDANGAPEDAEDDFWIDGDYHLLPGSLCIDAGDPCYVAGPNETDLDGNPRVTGGRVDMGAYECSYVEASMKLTPRRIIRHSRKKLIMAWMKLPEGITKDQIDQDTPLLLYPGTLEPINQYIFEHGKKGDKRVSIFAFYDKAELLAVVPDNGLVDVQVIGNLTTGQQFYGTDFVTILDRRQPRKR